MHAAEYWCMREHDDWHEVPAGNATEFNELVLGVLCSSGAAFKQGLQVGSARAGYRYVLPVPVCETAPLRLQRLEGGADQLCEADLARGGIVIFAARSTSCIIFVADKSAHAQ